jgi:hypothetical protein
MKHFGILTRRLFSSQGRPLLARGSLALLSLGGAYAFYHHTHSFSFSGVAMRHMWQPAASAEGADPYWRTRQGMKMDRHEEAVIIGATGSNPELAKAVSRGLGLKAPASTVSKRFADGEVFVKVDDNVNGKHVYIVQSTCPPVNDSLMELILTISACRRAGAASVTCIIPYYGYARQDRKF